jgi:protein SCO1
MSAELRKLRLTALALALTLAAAVCVQLWLERVRPNSVVETGTAAVGGAFRLIDQTGRTVTDRDFLGKNLVIHFGWRLDPDLTPAALQVLAASLDKIGRKTETVVPLFVSIDAERDNAQNLKDFIASIDGRISALSGSAEAISALAKAYKLYFKRLPDAQLPGGYSIDHASLYYVMGTDGGFLGVVPHTTDSAALAQEITRLLN